MLYKTVNYLYHGIFYEREKRLSPSYEDIGIKVILASSKPTFFKNYPISFFKNVNLSYLYST